MSFEHTPEHVVQQLLIAEGAGTAPSAKQAWPIYFSGMPDLNDDNIIVVSGTAGRDDGFTQHDGMQEMHGVQVAVRGTQESTASRKAYEVAELLDAVEMQAVTIGGASYRVHAVVRTSNVLAAGRESGTKRRLFTVNAVVPMEQL